MRIIRLASLHLVRVIGSFVGARTFAAIACSQIGEIRVAAKDYAGGAASFSRACDLDRDPQMKALDLGNLGYCQYRTGKLDEAAHSYQMGLALRYKNRFFDGMDTDLRNYYHVCHYLGRPKEAGEAYGMLMTPRGSPFTVKFDRYPLNLDEQGRDLPSVRVV